MAKSHISILLDKVKKSIDGFSFLAGVISTVLFLILCLLIIISLVKRLDPVIIAAIIQAIIILAVGIWIESYRHRKERRARLESLRMHTYEEFAELSRVCTDALFELLSADYTIKRFIEDADLNWDSKANMYKEQREKRQELSHYIDRIVLLSKKADLIFKSNLISTGIRQFATESSYIDPEWRDEDLSENELMDRYHQDVSAYLERLRPFSESIQTKMITELKDLM